jgi:metallo-beta-lactamase class B
MIWGGTSFNFGRDMTRLDGYIEQTQRMRQLVVTWGIDVPLSNHPGYDGTVAKLKAKSAAKEEIKNPFVSGQPVVDRAMRVLNACARAQRARFTQGTDTSAQSDHDAPATGDAWMASHGQNTQALVFPNIALSLSESHAH